MQEAETLALPEMDEDGLIVRPSEWNESVAKILADQIGIHTLSKDHWKVIYTLRDYYDEFGVAPAMTNICTAHGKSSNWVHSLFSTCLNAWIVSGLPNPGEEAKTYLSNR